MTLAAPPTLRGIERVIVLDTETTGVQKFDKIITMAALCIEGRSLVQRSLYLCFDPRKDSHPQAEAVHGWDNWTTRFQDLFADHADHIHGWMQWGDKLVMHNAEYDMHYVQRELRKSERPQLSHQTHCTMQQARGVWAGQKAGLDHCVERIGIKRRPGQHNALQDAFYTAALYLHFQGGKISVPEVDRWPMPRNYKAPEARPHGELPRRAMKRARA
jgi:DNA polymerase-3 subunit epsilon